MSPPGATSVQPPPSYTQPTPGYGRSAPRYAQQAPSYGQASPSYAQPQPAYGQPARSRATRTGLWSAWAELRAVAAKLWATLAIDASRPSPAQAYLSSQPPLNSPPVVGQSPSGAGRASVRRTCPAAGPPADAVPRRPARIAQPSGGNSAFGLDGFCPVSLLEKQQWVPGDRRWGMTHRGRTYLFAGPEEQARFARDPDRYAPVVSGNDVVLATEQGQTVTGMREHGVFFGNRVYLFSSEATLEKFAKNPNLYANQALEALRSGAYPGRLLR